MVSIRRPNRCSGTMLTADGHILWWKDFGNAVLAPFFNFSVVRYYLEDTSSAVHKAL